MTVHHDAVGALNLYSRTPGALPTADRDRAARFAGQAAGAVALALRLREREAEAQNLETALRSRSTIDQAVGILMARATSAPTPPSRCCAGAPRTATANSATSPPTSSPTPPPTAPGDARATGLPAMFSGRV
jgi:hypothetical protein